MPFRDRGRGTFRIDRRYPHVGRISRASGTNNPKLYKRYLTMLEELSTHGKVDVLRAIARGTLHPRDVFAQWAEHGMTALPSVAQARPLAPAMTEWLEHMERTKELSTQSLRGYRVVKKLLLRDVPKDTPVSELDGVLGQYRATAKGGRTFNLARAMCQSFVRRTLGRHDPLWYAVSSVPPQKVRRADGTPLPPEKALTVARALGGHHGTAWWTMCCTGMGPGEYWGEWEALEDRILIHGTKREGRERVVPRLGNPVEPATAYKALYNRLVTVRAKLAEDDPTLARLTLYDARRTFAHWLEMAQVPRSRRMRYLGHQTRDVTGLYEDHAPESYLAQDRRKLRKFVGLERAAYPLEAVA